MIDAVKLTSVTQIDILIRGAWDPQEIRYWRGTATASEPCVAVAFLRDGYHVEWCQSERTNESNLDLDLALFPYHKSEDLDIQVNFSIGQGRRRWRSILPSPVYRPTIRDSFKVLAGEVFQFTTVEGNPRVELFGLFIVQRDVEWVRRKIWHLQPRLRDAIQEPLKQVLTYGRAGTFEEKM
jgi:hypothetical protein